MIKTVIRRYKYIEKEVALLFANITFDAFYILHTIATLLLRVMNRFRRRTLKGNLDFATNGKRCGFSWRGPSRNFQISLPFQPFQISKARPKSIFIVTKFPRKLVHDLSPKRRDEYCASLDILIAQTTADSSCRLIAL